MIGHVFGDSGAVCLAVAPSSRLGDYLIVALTETDYVVATISTNSLIAFGGLPDHWMEGSYFRTAEEAVDNFAERTGITHNAALLDQVAYAERRIAREKKLA